MKLGSLAWVKGGRSAYRQRTQKAMEPELGIHEVAHDRGLSTRRRKANGYRGNSTGHVNAGVTSICREKSMDAGLRVAVTADKRALFMDAQNQGVRHEDVVDRDINLLTIQVRVKSCTEKPHGSLPGHP